MREPMARVDTDPADASPARVRGRIRGQEPTATPGLPGLGPGGKMAWSLGVPGPGNRGGRVMGQTTEAGDLLDRLRAGRRLGPRRPDRPGPGAVRGPGPGDAPAIPPRPALGGDRRPAPGRPDEAAPEPGRGPARGRAALRQPGGDPDPAGVDRPGPELPRPRGARGQPPHRRDRPRRAAGAGRRRRRHARSPWRSWAAFHEAVESAARGGAAGRRTCSGIGA